MTEFPLDRLVPFIDWTPFFRSWDLHGKYPDILNDKVVGSQATELFADAQAMLEKIIDEKWLEARARWGIFPANSQGDDILIYDPEQPERQVASWLTRPTTTKENGTTSLWQTLLHQPQ